jgi:hypothetical protein
MIEQTVKPSIQPFAATSFCLEEKSSVNTSAGLCWRIGSLPTKPTVAYAKRGCNPSFNIATHPTTFIETLTLET